MAKPALVEKSNECFKLDKNTCSWETKHGYPVSKEQIIELEASLDENQSYMKGFFKIGDYLIMLFEDRITVIDLFAKKA